MYRASGQFPENWFPETMGRLAMGHPYYVSHIYDATGSAKARYHEFLRAAETHYLAEALRRNDQGRLNRILSGLGHTLSAFSGKLRGKRMTGAETPA
jgi:hypothetical protein